MAALGLELSVPSVPSPRAEVRFWGFRREVALGRPVRVIRRDDFDASLVAQARDRGIEVREGAALAGFSVDGGGVDVAVGQRGRQGARQAERLRARVLVGADGVGSRVRKYLNGDSDGTPIRLFRLEVPARGAWRSDAMLYDFSPMTDGLRGYLWVFPVDGDRLNVGLMHDPGAARSGGELEALLARHLGRLGITLPRPRAAGRRSAISRRRRSPRRISSPSATPPASTRSPARASPSAWSRRRSPPTPSSPRSARATSASPAIAARFAAPPSGASWRSIAGWRACSIAATGAAGWRSSAATSACSSSTRRACRARWCSPTTSASSRWRSCATCSPRARAAARSPPPTATPPRR